MIPSRNPWHPLGRNRPPRPDAAPDQLSNLDTVEPDDALAPLADPEPEEHAAFMKSLRGDVENLREGVGISMEAAMRPMLKDRPWGKRHKRRDRYGRAF